MPAPVALFLGQWVAFPDFLIFFILFSLFLPIQLCLFFLSFTFCCFVWLFSFSLIIAFRRNFFLFSQLYIFNSYLSSTNTFVRRNRWSLSFFLILSMCLFLSVSFLVSFRSIVWSPLFPFICFIFK